MKLIRSKKLIVKDHTVCVWAYKTDKWSKIMLWDMYQTVDRLDTKFKLAPSYNSAVVNMSYDSGEFNLPYTSMGDVYETV